MGRKAFDKMTNEERFVYLLTFAKTGPVMHGFLVQACCEFARAVKRAPISEIEGGIVSSATWNRCADEVLQVMGEVTPPRALPEPKPADYRRTFRCTKCGHHQTGEPAKATRSSSGAVVVWWGAVHDFCEECDGPVVGVIEGEKAT